MKKEPLSKYISSLYNVMYYKLYKDLDKYNLICGMHHYLIFIYFNEGLTQEAISKALYRDKGSTARAIKKLEELKYIVRYQDAEDKRAYKVYVTDNAKKIMSELLNIIDSWNDVVTYDFSEEEKILALKLLKRMDVNAKIHHDRCKEGENE